MLTNPPCIRQLIGCNDGNAYSSPSQSSASSSSSFSSSQSSSSAQYVGQNGSQNSPSSSYSSRSNSSHSSGLGSFFGSSSSSSFSISSLSSGLGSLFGTDSSRSASASSVRLTTTAFQGSLLGSNRTSHALYTVTVKNLGNQAIANILVSHGPAPFGATFDAAHSSGCYQNGRSVQCTVSLNAGETKIIPIVYTVDNTAHCRLAPALQSVTVSGAPQGAAVTSTVQCEVKTGDAVVASISQMSSSIMSSYSSLASSASTGLPLAESGIGTSENPTAYEDCKSFKEDDELQKNSDGTKTEYKETGDNNLGYKPYSCPSRPRAGAATEYFLASAKLDFMTPVRAEHSGLGMMPVFLLSMVSAFIVLVLLQRGVSHRKGKRSTF